MREWHPARNGKPYKAITFYGTLQEALNEFRIWAIYWVGQLNNDSGTELYNELIKDNNFTEFDYDNKKYHLVEKDYDIEIHRLLCSYVGLSQELDTAEGEIVISGINPRDPMSDNCVDRYITTDGYFVDINICYQDFEDWYEQELEVYEVI
jgi:hypothetical protein